MLRSDDHGAKVRGGALACGLSLEIVRVESRESRWDYPQSSCSTKFGYNSSDSSNASNEWILIYFLILASLQNCAVVKVLLRTQFAPL